MTIDSQDIERDIAHQRNMLRVLRGRLQQRELQEAQYGLNAPPEIVQEIHELTERIQRHELEIRRLQSEAAIDKIPLTEVEYRSLLAQEWDTPRGRPTVAGTTRLDLMRLRLGISPLRAKELEAEIREALANEQLLDLSQAELMESLRDFLDHQDDKEIRSRFSRKFIPIVRTLRLHTPLVVPWLLQHLEVAKLPDVALAWKVFLLNPTEFSEFDNELLNHFLTDLEQAVIERKQTANTTLAG